MTDLIAYFSMEIALASEIPTYAGGLGVLAGDTLRSAADLGLPMVGVTLLYRKGYFRQVLDANGHQTEKDVVWAPEQYLERLPTEVEVQIRRPRRCGRRVALPRRRRRRPPDPGLPARHRPRGQPRGGPADHRSPVRGRGALPADAGGRARARRAAMLDALGLQPTRYHMNEGHSSLLALDLLRKIWRRASRGRRA
jgi:starch phosphorylase